MVAHDEESDKTENERRESDSDIHRPRDKGARIQAHIHRQRAGGGDGIGAVTQWRADGGCVGEKSINYARARNARPHFLSAAKSVRSIRRQGGAPKITKKSGVKNDERRIYD